MISVPHKLKKYTGAGLVFLIGLIVSYFFFRTINNDALYKAEQDFKLLAYENILDIQRNITSEFTVIRAMSGFHNGSTNVGREEFKHYVRDVSVDRRSVFAYGWIPRVPESERATYEQAARNEGYDNFQFTEKSPQNRMVRAGSRDEYLPVYYIEPYDGNQTALGYDLASDPERLAALEQARDTGLTVATSRINLVQIEGDNAAILLLSPVYSEGGNLETVEGRRQSLRGFSSGVIRIPPLMASFSEPTIRSQSDIEMGIDFLVFDMNAPKDNQLLYAHNSIELTVNDARSGLWVEKSINVGGRTWAFIAKPADSNLGVATSQEGLIALLSSLVIFGVLTLHLVLNARRTADIARLVKDRTAELQERDRFISSVLETALNGIISFDDRGRLKSFNRAAENLFGYSEDEVIGSNVKMLIPERYHSEYDDNLLSYLTTGEANEVIGVEREITGLHKDGSTIAMELSIGEMEFTGERMFTGIVRDITDRQQADRLKQEFISTVSHELRTPLTSIKGSLGLILSGAICAVPEKLSALLDIANSNCDRLVRLINDILDMEKVEADSVQFEMAPLELGSLLNEALDANRGYGEDYSVSFELTHEPIVANILGDRDRLMQVLANLMSNAAKFSPEDSVIEISLTASEEGFRIAVTDKGPGISEQFREKLYSKFTQSDSSDTRAKGGTGLGLSITKAIVERHNGSINYENQDQGCTFYIDLPKLQEHKLASGITLEESAPRRILICEDEPVTAALLEEMLNEANFITDIAQTAEEVEKLLHEHTYSAITLDLVLPDKDGITLFKELRSKPETEKLPVVFISGQINKEAKELSGGAFGIVDWMDKPVDKKRLLNKIRAVRSISSSGKPQILHVEDDLDVIQIVSDIIGDIAETTAARSIEHARRLLEEKDFDLLLLDLLLPDGNGEKLIPFLRSKDGNSVPIIVFSAVDIENQSARENIQAALIKSRTSNEQLLQTISSAIESGLEREQLD